jgi:low affinity Fe/Cu permease
MLQNTQNRDNTATQLKLDGIIRAIVGAHLRLVDLEELSKKSSMTSSDATKAMAERARKALRQGGPDTAAPEIDLERAADKSWKGQA